MTHGNDYVFMLHHTITRGDAEDDKIIGVYSTRAEAEAAIERLKNKPGFRDPRGEFGIGPYKLNRDHFGDGFGPG